jgi:hypothetical protein
MVSTPLGKFKPNYEHKPASDESRLLATSRLSAAEQPNLRKFEGFYL